MFESYVADIENVTLFLNLEFVQFVGIDQEIALFAISYYNDNCKPAKRCLNKRNRSVSYCQKKEVGKMESKTMTHFIG